MADSPFISIIICTYNRAEYLRDSLNSLLNTPAAASLFEVLIIDNNSTDHTKTVTEETIASFPNKSIRYVRETAQGLSHARNRGIKEAQASILLFLDDDITANPHFIPAWLSFFDEHPEAAGGGGKIHVQFDDPRPPWMSHFLMPLLGYHDLGNSVKKYPPGKYPFGGNMAFRRKVFDQYGGFNTELGRKGKHLMASEEKEFYRRLQGKEDIYYVPRAFLHHRVNKKRLTRGYIKKQALGLGKSIAMQLQEASKAEKIYQLGNEFFKSIATVLLCVGYSLVLQFSKASMLIKFRRWIWRGYAEYTANHKSAS
ncbi:MAG: glycosyltransferase family 2 protein [Balneolaceae bacterium]|nr:glycosyltransferase family 2 protein [Balneolaceae bacterium]